jgi:hypothetical protein
MRLDELFRQSEYSRDEVLLRMKNAKSKEEKEKWAAYLVKNRMNLTEEALKSYLDRLVSKEGIQKLGGGAFSQVFQHPEYGNVVVKVYTDKDAVYRKYVSWCLKNQSNPYVPKIVEQVKYKSPETGEKYNIIFLQKMTPIKTHKKVLLLLARAMNVDEFDEVDLDDVYEIGAGSGKKFYDLMNQLVTNKDADPDFVKVWKFIASFGADKLDLHPENVMLRDGHLVLTDPVASEPTSRVDGL